MTRKGRLDPIPAYPGTSYSEPSLPPVLIDRMSCDSDGRAALTIQLHNSHLASRSLPYSSKADLSIPYLLRPTRGSLESAIDSWAKICGAEVVDSASSSAGEKQIIVVEVSKDDGKLDHRRLSRQVGTPN